MHENIIFLKKYKGNEAGFSINKREIWRYAGYSGVATEIPQELQMILETVIQELRDAFSYQVCYRRTKVEWNKANHFCKESVAEGMIPISNLSFLAYSKDLAKCLKGSEELILFAATIGLETDRYIAKYQRISPIKALLAQAYGAERIERLCDVFCKEIQEEAKKESLSCTARFSPGYGDLPLEAQTQFFQLLDCQRQIGLTLNDSLLMSPSKSVTAVFGLGTCVGKEKEQKCDTCEKMDCEYRKAKR